MNGLHTIIKVHKVALDRTDVRACVRLREVTIQDKCTANANDALVWELDSCIA